MTVRKIYCEECKHYYLNSNIDRHYNTKKHKLNYFLENRDEYENMIIETNDLIKLSNPNITDDEYINIMMKYIN